MVTTHTAKDLIPLPLPCLWGGGGSVSLFLFLIVGGWNGQWVLAYSLYFSPLPGQPHPLSSPYNQSGTVIFSFSPIFERKKRDPD